MGMCVSLQTDLCSSVKPRSGCRTK